MQNHINESFAIENQSYAIPTKPPPWWIASCPFMTAPKLQIAFVCASNFYSLKLLIFTVFFSARLASNEMKTKTSSRQGHLIGVSTNDWETAPLVHRAAVFSLYSVQWLIWYEKRGDQGAVATHEHKNVASKAHPRRNRVHHTGKVKKI